MGHINIPIFIPHLGCPNQCIFCNQRYISGKLEFDETIVEKEILKVLSTVKESDDCEIAFFGGSFTGIDRALMIRLLDIAQKYVDLKKVSGIRMSTRPDYIDEEIIDILKRYTVSFVELGIQSMNDDVLRYLKRGHTRKDTERAAELLRKNGFSFVGQMMIGLPSATPSDEIECAKAICELGACGARIYPTLVFKMTELERMANEEIYIPITVEEAVTRCADVLKIFLDNDVECIRIGLCESENLHSDSTFVCGPNHPSIGEMVKSELFLRNIEKQLLCKSINNKNMIIFCPKGCISQIIGNKKRNLMYIKEKYRLKSVKVLENTDLKNYEVKIYE